MEPQYNGFLKATHNWNQVCNAGISFGALATFEDHPALSRILLNRAIQTIDLPMQTYGPDGTYAEGYSYWGYGTTFNVLLVSALEKAFGQDFGLSKKPGFLKTAGYLQHLTGPTGQSFNYSDAGTNAELQPAMFWFASKLKDPSVLWVEKTHLLKGDYFKNRLLPAVMLWGGNFPTRTITEPKATIWVGAGDNPVALMRSSWSDSAAIYVGIKGGSPSINHGHMDVGSFVMEADGVRWAMDFGMQQYELLESKGVDLWNMKQDSQRWKILRYNNFVHNTLTVNNFLQKVEGRATITSHSKSPAFMNATLNLTELYSDFLAQANRGIAIVDRQSVVVQDELSTKSAAATIRWTLLTPASVKITGKNTAELTKNGKRLLLKVQEPANIKMKTWSTDPVHDYDAPNPGTTLVGFEVQLPADSKAVLTVWLLPEKAVKKANQKIQPLQKWPRE